jgi:hypothetical protein
VSVSACHPYSPLQCGVSSSIPVVPDLVRTAECYLAHARYIYSRRGMSLDHQDLQADIRIPPNRDWGGK